MATPPHLQPVLTLYSSIEKVKEAVTTRYESWPCTNGCSFCCHFSVFLVSRSEWEIMQLGLRELSHAKHRAVKAKARQAVKTTFKGYQQLGWYAVTRRQAQAGAKLTCPHLTEGGACSIYSTRPSVCRLYGYCASSDKDGTFGLIHGCGLVERYVAEQKIPQMIDIQPILSEMEQSLSGESRPIAGWLSDDKEFRPRKELPR